MTFQGMSLKIICIFQSLAFHFLIGFCLGVCHIAQYNLLFAGHRHEFQTISVIHDLAENFSSRST